MSNSIGKRAASPKPANHVQAGTGGLFNKWVQRRNQQRCESAFKHNIAHHWNILSFALAT
jgi:hypothetical protein